MEYTLLADSTLRVSRVGFGCAAIGGYDYGEVDDATSIRAIHHALDLGVNLFDTADVYGFGHAEVILGRALAQAGVQDAVVATKVGVRWDERGGTARDLSTEWVRSAVEGSLRRLRLERIPLYQIHWPDPKTPIAETMKTLTELRSEGKIGAIGCCNFDVDLVAQAERHGHLISGQLPFSLVDQQQGTMIRECASRLAIPTLAYNVLAHGLFSGKYGTSASFRGTDLRKRIPLFSATRMPQNLRLLHRLYAVGEQHGKTAAQVAIRWALQQEGVAVALTGIKTPEQIEENVGGSGWSLSSLEWEALARDENVVTNFSQSSR